MIFLSIEGGWFWLSYPVNIRTVQVNVLDHHGITYRNSGWLRTIFSIYFKITFNLFILEISCFQVVTFGTFPLRSNLNENKKNNIHQDTGVQSPKISNHQFGVTSEAFLTAFLQLNKQCCGAILSSVKIYACWSNSNTREY